MMPTCQQCKKTWNWKQAFRNSLRITGEMICPICKEKQYVTRRTRNITTLITFLLILFLFGLHKLIGFSGLNVLIALSFIPLTMALYPFWFRLSNEEELF